jgi:DNA-binding GntR family transcriptional regulator
MARVTTIPDIDVMESLEARQAIPRVHGYLRERIIAGTIQPGATLSQLALARQLGVSRTPLREVLLLLREEGLVAMEPNQRTRVTELDPQELDDLYAGRILLETLAVSMTVPSFGAVQHEAAIELLRRMCQAQEDNDLEAWFDTHTRYHALLTAGSGEAMQRRLRIMADQTARYIRINQLIDATWQSDEAAEHEKILDALVDGRLRDALVGMARHMASTALRVLGGYAPHYEPVATPRAVDIVNGLPTP